MYTFSFKSKNPTQHFALLMVAKAHVERVRDVYLSGDVPELFRCEQILGQVDNFTTITQLLVARYDGLIAEEFCKVSAIHSTEALGSEITLTVQSDKLHVAEAYVSLLMCGLYDYAKSYRCTIAKHLCGMTNTGKDITYTANSWFYGTLPKSVIGGFRMYNEV